MPATPHALVALLATTAHAGLVDPALDDILRATPPDAFATALLSMTDRVDTSALTARLDAEDATLARRHEVVVRALRATAARRIPTSAWTT